MGPVNYVPMFEQNQMRVVFAVVVFSSWAVHSTIMIYDRKMICVVIG